MIMRPRLLLADEPTGNLDSVSGAQILEMLDRLHAGGLTLLVVTHDPQVARRAERTLVMADGRVLRRLTSGQMRDASPSWGSAASS
jgi:putative ABC transport system ATP-binding protein